MLIAGCILHSKGKETCHQIAQFAMQHDSPLAMAAEALFKLEELKFA
jgi:hypothetical protein